MKDKITDEKAVGHTPGPWWDSVADARRIAFAAIAKAKGAQ